MLFEHIEKLVQYGIDTGLTAECERIYTRNLLLDLFHEDAWEGVILEGQEIVLEDVIKQGEYFYDEGGMGGGKPNRFATHVHIEAGKGKWKSTTQAPNSKGTYVCERQEHLYNMFFVPENTVVLNDGGYSWIKEEKKQSDTEKLKAKIAQLEKDLEAEIELRRAYQQENEKLKLNTEKLKSDYDAEKTIRNAYYKEYTSFKNKFEQIGKEKAA